MNALWRYTAYDEDGEVVASSGYSVFQQVIQTGEKLVNDKQAYEVVFDVRFDNPDILLSQSVDGVLRYGEFNGRNKWSNI
jgi:hypothetical protein